MNSNEVFNGIFNMFSTKRNQTSRRLLLEKIFHLGTHDLNTETGTGSRVELWISL